MFILAVWWGWEFASNGGFNDDPSSKKEEWKTGGTKRCEQVPLHKCGFASSARFVPAKPCCRTGLDKGNQSRSALGSGPTRQRDTRGRKGVWVGGVMRT